MNIQSTTLAVAVALAVSFPAWAADGPGSSTTMPDANSATNSTLDAMNARLQDMDGSMQRRTSEIEQRGGGNLAEVTQGGNAQRSRIYQSGDNVRASVEQTGDQNDSLIFQQYGMSDMADVKQLDGQSSKSLIEQSEYSGHNNQATVLQTNANLSDSIIVQNGDSNDAQVEQTYTNQASSVIYQDGMENITKVSQINADTSASYVYQTGTGHEAYVMQGSRLLENSLNNVSTIRQSGNAAMAHVYQDGAHNTAITTQW